MILSRLRALEFVRKFREASSELGPRPWPAPSLECEEGLQEGK